MVTGKHARSVFLGGRSPGIVPIFNAAPQPFCLLAALLPSELLESSSKRSAPLARSWPIFFSVFISSLAAASRSRLAACSPFLVGLRSVRIPCSIARKTANVAALINVLAIAMFHLRWRARLTPLGRCRKRRPAGATGRWTLGSLAMDGGEVLKGRRATKRSWGGAIVRQQGPTVRSASCVTLAEQLDMPSLFRDGQPRGMGRWRGVVSVRRWQADTARTRPHPFALLGSGQEPRQAITCGSRKTR
jgi:hypothetical protein